MLAGRQRSGHPEDGTPPGWGPHWPDLRKLPRQIVVHITVPHRLFRRGRGRDVRAPLRTPECPWGCVVGDPDGQRVLLAENALAVRIAELVTWLIKVGPP